MKEFKTYNQQLKILRRRGLTVPKDGSPKRFLEQENYYNVINGYNDLFLEKDHKNRPIIPETYIEGAHFNELKALFLFDRELRMIFLKYTLIFENSFKTVLSHEFSKYYPKPNSYLDIANYDDKNPKKVLQQILILTKTIQEKVDKNGAIRHYIERYDSVPLWVLVNYLTIGNLSHLYSVFKEPIQENIAFYYSNKFSKQYRTDICPKISTRHIKSALQIFNFIRNKCAHDERLFNVYIKTGRADDIGNYFGIEYVDNRKLFVAILNFKLLLNKDLFEEFYDDLLIIFDKFANEFHTISFKVILNNMGIDIKNLSKLR